jgi:peptidoglycan/LPS O-acetylase OafA/YrhL/hydrogenase maturation factor
LAVVAVVVYHGNTSWLKGGFLGVEIFFVISGYLITMLLLSEHRRTGRLSLRHFWFRRGRRLLPAVYALLFVVSIVSVLFVKDQLDRLKGDLFAALTYTMNWHLVLGGTSYFDQFGRPPLLQHLWSLAVEEQFYLVWPIVLVLLLRRWRTRPDRLLLVMVGGALASAGLMALLYHQADPSRVYYGTDTRLAGLLLGSALAVFWHPRALQEGVPPVRPRAVSVAGAAGFVTLIVLCIACTERGPFLYRGGFLLVDLATLGVIAAVAHPAVRFGRAFEIPALVYIGVRSYSIYLWHWPVFALTRPGEDIGLGPVPVFVIRIVITAVLAELSYRLVEAPIRSGAIGRWARAWGQSRGMDKARRTRNALLAGAGLALAITLVTTAVLNAKPSASAIEQSIQAGQLALSKQSTIPTASVAPTSTGPQVGTLPPVQTTVAAPPARITGIGDSVMLGAAPALVKEFGSDIRVEAKVARQFGAGVDIVRLLKSENQLGQWVIVHLGNNGPVSADAVDQMLDLLRGVPHVLVINVRVTRSYEGRNNATLAAEAAKYPNVKLFDWHGASACCGDWFYKDRTHMKINGIGHYADLVAAQIGYVPPTTTTSTPAAAVAPATTPAPTTTAVAPPPAAGASPAGAATG